MKKEIILDCPTTLSIVTGFCLTDRFTNINIAIDNFCNEKLSDKNKNKMQPIIRQYILDKYPKLKEVIVPNNINEEWIKEQSEKYGKEFTFEPYKKVYKQKKTKYLVR